MNTRFTTSSAELTELMNLRSILNLPKGTEHFVSDLHGEFEAFQHVLRNGSGSIKEKIAVAFQNKLTTDEQNELAFLIYYPEEVLDEVKQKMISNEEINIWQKDTIQLLIELVRFSSTKYTRSKVRKSLPPAQAYLIEELLYQDASDYNKQDYYEQILSDIILFKQADTFIVGLSYTIQRLVVDHLHVVGDIYDRGPSPDKIMETLIHHHSVDIQWGNHDIIWLGAFAGSHLCMTTVIRICARYNNLSIIEDSYGINLRPLLSLAETYYDDNPAFRPKEAKDSELTDKERRQITQIHQAIAMMQFKLELQWIDRRPEYAMEKRALLRHIDYETETIHLNGKTYPLENTCFHTVNPEAPDLLLPEEKKVLKQLMHAFQHSEKLKRHLDFLIKKGSMYLCYNNNLLIHGCMPLTEDGQFQSLTLHDQHYQGKALLDFFEEAVRTAYEQPDSYQDFYTDTLWYLWCGEYSSLFGKDEMTTFERYFIKDKATHVENKNPYYRLRNCPTVCQNILTEFGLSETDSHIINGHTPVKEINGENPIKAEGKLIVIDGGFSKPYQQTTGIAGYTLIYNSYGMQLVAHQPFTSKKEALKNRQDIISTKRLVDRVVKRKRVKETNIGAQLLKMIDELNKK
ncbi:fructose-1,6-bisphosphatase [Vagococcus lutrae]|uniref:fructose-1,6-bisphosphatase n=1 Tax=Vagococcus lutrae TaxID=81947 RepID=UPI001C93FDD4|nr:fructose-1,6-bisphosphatase [Vagococcus lutrae]MDT2801395.1 fructose-1,6-bisphosphatase [Vagococcus lutrae]MDT2817270.1 fructose-1,6-bisphosphatase [Vagococcus lutrae]MDT2826353.1 fructose-1,6-bisphosphatase [Vagococcus lutrae]MDT2841542.1 fructose-1,6-bisphosphatase [Vagococcus lutrae]QZN88593.1 fructose-1,6-bisphosphatase [Vagococcus lutrae]